MQLSVTFLEESNALQEVAIAELPAPRLEFGHSETSWRWLPPSEHLLLTTGYESASLDCAEVRYAQQKLSGTHSGRDRCYSASHLLFTSVRNTNACPARMDKGLHTISARLYDMSSLAASAW